MSLAKASKHKQKHGSHGTAQKRHDTYKSEE